MKKATIDLNCDLGEIEATWNSGRDQKLLKHLTSVNISCGAHAGSEELIGETIAASIKYNLNIGAHPGFPDKANFGRKRLGMSAQEVEKMCFEQIGFLKEKVEKAGGHLHHVKPHGALYNWAAEDEEVSRAICEAILKTDSKLVIVCLPSSETEKVAKEMGLAVCREAFTDRTYQKDGSLTSRSADRALIEEPEIALEQVRSITEKGFVISVSGQKVPLKVDTFCIHGDRAGALRIAEILHENL